MFSWIKNFRKKETEYQRSAHNSDTSAYTIMKPEPFGYKSIWLAVKSESAITVAEAVCGAGYKDIKVYESVDGWVIVRDLDVPLTDFATVKSVNEKSNGFEDYIRLLEATDCINHNDVKFLEDLSKLFGCVCHFASHRVTDYYSWAKFIDGSAVRIFAFVADNMVLADDGLLTSEEEELEIWYEGYNQKWLNGQECDDPTEDDVIAIAEAWTINPTKLGTHN